MKPRHSTLSSLVIHSLAGTAVADVYYSKFQNITIPADYAGVYLDVDGGNGWNTNMFSPVSGWDINPYFGGSTVANSPTFKPVRSGTGSLDPSVNLAAGTTIGSEATMVAIRPMAQCGEFCDEILLTCHATPFSPRSGPATRSSNGLHPKSNFQAMISAYTHCIYMIPIYMIPMVWFSPANA